MIAIISDNMLDRQECRDKLATRGISTCFFGSLDDLRSHHGNQAFSGVVVQDYVLLGGSFRDKALVGGLEELLPVLRYSRRSPDKVLIGSVGNTRLEGHGLWDAFAERCRKTRPTSLRTDLRRKLFLNVSCSLSETESFKTNTWDLSLHGCFILHGEEVPLGKAVGIVINDLTDKTPMEGIVRWNLPWGRSASRPAGFGVTFSKISESQRAELHRFLEEGSSS